MSEFSALELVGSTVGRVRRTLGLNTVDGDPALDRLARLAARLLGVPVALVSLVDVDEQVFPGQSGLPDTRSTPLSHSFCKTVVATREVVTTVDAREDPRFASNPAIPDLGVIAYAGWPLLTASGEALGALCAIDMQPREWSAEDVETLHDLADAAVAELEGRAARILAEQALAREAHTAATLQHAVLPGALPVMDGMQIAARYAPAENLIGGDWYDAFRLPGARMGLAIGDVVGHDVDAAATAVQLRSALRGAALEDPAPGRVMGRLNDLAHESPLAAFSSAAFGVLDLEAMTWTWARAGHLAMLVRSPVGDDVRGRAGRDPARVRPAGRAVRGSDAGPGARNDARALHRRAGRAARQRSPRARGAAALVRRARARRPRRAGPDADRADGQAGRGGRRRGRRRQDFLRAFPAVPQRVRRC